MTMTWNYLQSKKFFGNLRRKSLKLGVLLLCCLLLAPGCSGPGSDVQPDAKGWFGSAEELARAVSRALSANDRTVLDRFRISRDEYMAVVWPELPISKIEQWKGQSGFVWSQHTAKSDSGLQQVLRRFGESPLQLVSVRLSGQVQEYEGVKIHIKPEFTMKNSAGDESKARLMGSIIEISGRFKVFSYNIEQ